MPVDAARELLDPIGARAARGGGAAAAPRRRPPRLPGLPGRGGRPAPARGAGGCTRRSRPPAARGAGRARRVVRGRRPRRAACAGDRRRRPDGTGGGAGPARLRPRLRAAGCRLQSGGGGTGAPLPALRPGDRIAVAGNTGTVSAIDLRYTVLERDDGDRVLPPDRPVLSNAVRVARRSGSADSRDRPPSARSRDRWSRTGRPRAAPPAAGGPPRVIRPLPIP